MEMPLVEIPMMHICGCSIIWSTPQSSYANEEMGNMLPNSCQYNCPWCGGVSGIKSTASSDTITPILLSGSNFYYRRAVKEEDLFKARDNFEKSKFMINIGMFQTRPQPTIEPTINISSTLTLSKSINHDIAPETCPYCTESFDSEFNRPIILFCGCFICFHCLDILLTDITTTTPTVTCCTCLNTCMPCNQCEDIHCAATNNCLLCTYLFVFNEISVNSIDDNGKQPIHYASSKGHFNVVQWLTKHGANINAIENDSVTPIHNASSGGHLNIVQWLVERGGNINVADNEGWTPLFNASSGGYLNVVQWLTKHGANINAVENDGSQPIHWASLLGRLDVVEYLTEHGSNINATDNNGRQPIHQASISGRLDIVKYLTERGANINAATNTGLCPIHVAIECFDIVKWLTEHGANINAVDNDGKRPIFYANKFKKSDVIRYLMSQSGTTIPPPLPISKRKQTHNKNK